MKYLVSVAFAVSSITMNANVDGMVSCGSAKRFPFSLHRAFLRATNARKQLKPACTIPCVGKRILLIYIFYLDLIKVNIEKIIVPVQTIPI